MWRSDLHIKALQEIEACKTIYELLKQFLEKFGQTPNKDTRSNTELDEQLKKLYNSLLIEKNLVECLRMLPLEWQAIFLTHLQNSNLFIRTRYETKNDELETKLILPSNVKLFKSLAESEYWNEMMNLCIKYAYGISELPDVSKSEKKLVKGSEAVLRVNDIHKNSKSYDDEEDRLFLHANLQPIQSGDIPKVKLETSLRVFSEQNNLTNPQPELERLTCNSIIWEQGFIWTHTYPFWRWENDSSIRLDITIPKNTEVMYTPYAEISMFTPINNSSRHMTLILEPGTLTVTSIQEEKLPKLQPPFHDELPENALSDQSITIIKCTYNKQCKSLNSSAESSSGEVTTPQKKKIKLDTIL